MSADRAPKPPNNQRLVPTVSFSVPRAQLERLREIAYTRDVSLSRVVREALDVAFQIWESPGRTPPGGLAKYPRRSQADSDGLKTGAHKPTGLPRQLRREIARGDYYSDVDDSSVEDWGPISEGSRSRQAGGDFS